MTDCDFPVFFVHKEPVARKEHQCCECSAPILKGEKHFHLRGKWDWGIESYRQHLACMEACMTIRDDVEGECIAFGSLMDWYNEFKRDLNREKHKKLRHLMAVILMRERRCRLGILQ